MQLTLDAHMIIQTYIGMCKKAEVYFVAKESSTQMLLVTIAYKISSLANVIPVLPVTTIKLNDQKCRQIYTDNNYMPTIIVLIYTYLYFNNYLGATIKNGAMS